MSEITNTVSINTTSSMYISSSDHPPFSAIRIRNNTPSEYRLVRRDSCTYVLQGGFHWTEGTKAGIEWIDLPTIDERPTNEIT
jgi:hypothetical protein